MEADEYARRVLEIEAHVQRAGFLCPGTCTLDFFAHGELAITFMLERLDAEVYGVTPPAQPDSDDPHVVENVMRIAADFAAEKARKRAF